MGKDTAHRKQERYQLEFGDPTEMGWELALGRTTGTEQTQIEQNIVLSIWSTGIIIIELGLGSIWNGEKRKSYLVFFCFFIVLIFRSWLLGDLDYMDGNHVSGDAREWRG
jgi:hypothetical protein